MQVTYKHARQPLSLRLLSNVCARQWSQVVTVGSMDLFDRGRIATNDEITEG